jgi:hypothetical protein
LNEKRPRRSGACARQTCRRRPCHVVEKTGVGREVRPRRAADRLLVDPHEPSDRRDAFDDVAANRLRLAGEERVEFVVGIRRDGAFEMTCDGFGSAWFTRLDFSDPETPVTVVKQPSGIAAEFVQVVKRQSQQ